MPLFINGNPVNKISGPISMFILTPKRNHIFPNLPVYMLFGDYHESDKNMCVDNPPGTLDVYGTDFLGLLNTLVKPNDELIDFYIEGGDLHNKQRLMPNIEKYPMRMIWDLYSQCYSNIRAEKKLAQYNHQTDCNKISNVRFQSGDSRFFKYHKKYAKLLIECNMQTFLSLFKSKEDLNTDKFVSNLKRFKKSFKGGNCIEKLLNTTISFEDVNNEIFSEEGLIYKQLKKFSPEQRDKMIDYIKTYCSYAEKIYYKVINKYKIINIYTELMNIISKLRFNMDAKNVDMKSLEYLKDNWDYVEKYSDVLISDKHSIVADIYTLCRSFKYLNSQENPIMNLVYFGNIHTNNVVHFLTKITKLYDKVEIKSVQSYDTINRCIEIKNDIDLDKILNDAKQIRNKILPQGSPGRITPVPPRPLPVRQPSPHIEPSNIRRQEQICLCINKSKGKRCENKAKLPSEFCGIHKNCKEVYRLK